MNETSRRFDVITLGETMLRFTPSAMLRFEQSVSVEMHVGGSESNTAVGLSRLGHQVAWLSRMTNNPLGRHVVNTLNQHAVNTSHVQWTDSDRVGLYFLEAGKLPRGSQVIYDRRGSAMANMRPSDLPESLFAANRAKLFHTTGITLGISDSAAATAMAAMQLAKKANWQVSLDVNYRAGLWGAQAARQVIEPAMELSDVIFIPFRDAKLLFMGGSEASARDTVEALAKRFSGAIVVMTMSAEGAMLASQKVVLQESAIPTEAVERLGGGDAFSAGFLSKYLESMSSDVAHLQDCLRWGCAVAALKYTIPGDLPIIDREQVLRVLSQRGSVSIHR